MTQLGRRPIQKCWKWVKLLAVEVRLRKDMEDQGMNHDSNTGSRPMTQVGRRWVQKVQRWAKLLGVEVRLLGRDGELRDEL